MLFGLLLWCEVFQELQMAFFAYAGSILFSPEVLQNFEVTTVWYLA